MSRQMKTESRGSACGEFRITGMRLRWAQGCVDPPAVIAAAHSGGPVRAGTPYRTFRKHKISLRFNGRYAILSRRL